MLHHYEILRSWSSNLAESTPILYDDENEIDLQFIKGSETTSRSELVVLGLTFCMLFLGLGTLAWGTVKVSQGAAMVDQTVVQHTGHWGDLR